MKKEDLIANFDPSGPALNDNIFGLPYAAEHAEVIIFPVPWEVTVSYSPGTANAPEAIKKASFQVDLFDPAVKDAWKIGIWKAPENAQLSAISEQYRSMAEDYLAEYDEVQTEIQRTRLEGLNNACANMVDYVKTETLAYLNQGKKIALLGGDHSTPLGYLQALAEKHPTFGILQIDAHADLRDAYEGFEYSHASIMTNALKIQQVEKLVQVGIRDYCQEEVDAMEAQNGRVKTFFDRDLKRAQFEGETWKNQVQEIVNELPQNVYLSFDIDGLDPKLCPNTGTPVAGGFETEEVLYLVESVLQSGRQLIGFDLNEVSPREDEWDANVGARLLYRLCNLMGAQ